MLNYSDKYKNQYFLPTNVQATETIGAYTTLDLHFGYKLPAVGRAEGTELVLDIDNLFDADPPFARAGNGYGNGNVLGRVFTFGVRKKFRSRPLPLSRRSGFFLAGGAIAPREASLPAFLSRLHPPRPPARPMGGEGQGSDGVAAFLRALGGVCRRPSGGDGFAWHLDRGLQAAPPACPQPLAPQDSLAWPGPSGRTPSGPRRYRREIRTDLCRLLATVPAASAATARRALGHQRQAARAERCRRSARSSATAPPAACRPSASTTAELGALRRADPDRRTRSRNPTPRPSRSPRARKLFSPRAARRAIARARHMMRGRAR